MASAHTTVPTRTVVLWGVVVAAIVDWIAAAVIAVELIAGAKFHH